MTDEPLSPEDQQEMEELAGLVAKSLAEGKKPAEITQQLVDGGWKQDDAEVFVNSISLHLINAQHAAQPSHAGSGVPGWAIWIGELLLINLLSWLFNWPLWVY